MFGVVTTTCTSSILYRQISNSHDITVERTFGCLNDSAMSQRLDEKKTSREKRKEILSTS
jgi:hypothetical protein